MEWITLNNNSAQEETATCGIVKEPSQVKEIDNSEILVKLVINIPLKKTSRPSCFFLH